VNRVYGAFSEPSAAIVAASDLPRQAAVALIFVKQERPMLMMIKRSTREDDPWSGQMAFPGGHRDGQETLLEAAIRETREEIGVDLSSARLLGALPQLMLPPRLNLPRMVIQPFGFELSSPPITTTNREVASVHSFALDELYDGLGRGEFVWQKHDRPITLPEVRLGGVKIWGISLRIIDQMIGFV